LSEKLAEVFNYYLLILDDKLTERKDFIASEKYIQETYKSGEEKVNKMGLRDGLWNSKPLLIERNYIYISLRIKDGKVLNSAVIQLRADPIFNLYGEFMYSPEFPPEFEVLEDE